MPSVPSGPTGLGTAAARAFAGPAVETPARWTPNPLAGAAAAHTAAWLDGYGVRSPRVERYATLAAWVYPAAPLADLELASDVSAFFRLFDDFTDDLGAEPRSIHRVCQELVGTLYGAVPDTLVGRMFAELWARQTPGMPAGWTVRTLRHWEWYFSTQAPYAAMLDPRADWTTTEYLELRHGNGAVPVCLDLGERALGTAVPPHVHHCTQLRLMRRLASDIIVHCNDIHSDVRDRTRNDPRNLVAHEHRRTGRDRTEAVAATRRAMRALNTELSTRRERLRTEGELLEFTATDRAHAEAAATIILDWNDGYQAWAADNELLMDTDPPRAAVAARLTGRG